MRKKYLWGKTTVQRENELLMIVVQLRLQFPSLPIFLRAKFAQFGCKFSQIVLLLRQPCCSPLAINTAVHLLNYEAEAECCTGDARGVRSLSWGERLQELLHTRCQ